MKVSKSTIVRTIMMLLVIVNIILERTGYDIINVDESSILTLVELLIEIAIMIVGFWKNNSYSENAIKADEFLQTLRASSDTEDVSQENIESEGGDL
jgi:SPP1 family holin